MNVIVLVADSFRADHLGCYGNKWIRTPNLDHFAAESALFKYSYPENIPTVPARVTWFTGQYHFPFRGWQPFELDDTTLAEYLWAKGFKSAMITDVFHFHRPGFNITRGFDFVQFIRGQESDPFVLDESIEVDMDKYHKHDGVDEVWTRQTMNYLRNRAHWKSEEDHFVAQVVKAGMKWLGEIKTRDNLFLWLDCFDPHEPWDPPREYTDLYDPGYEGKEIINPIVREVEGYLTPQELNHIKALYAGEITLVDKWLGIFLDYLRSEGFFQNSIIIFTSDHGEPLGERGIIRKARHWLFEELMRIPFLIYTPGAKPVISNAVAQTCDLMPTVLDFLGIDNPDWVEGQSLLPVIRGEKANLRDFAYCGAYRHAWTIRNAEWNFTCYLTPQKPAGGFCPSKRELYHLADDPREQQNVIEKFDDVAAQLEHLLFRFVIDLQHKRLPPMTSPHPKWRRKTIT
jgi:arylsulfatase A-like enzyme